MRTIKSSQIIRTFFVVGISFLLVSCSIFPSSSFQSVSSFDLGNPQLICPKGMNITVKPFRNDTACKFKMIYRTEGCRILVDDYNKWTQPPGLMMTRYLQLAFTMDPDSKTGKETNLMISGTIVAFEADFDKKVCRLGVDYQISDSKSRKVLLEHSRIFKEPFSKKTAQAFASALSAATAKFANTLKQELSSLKTSEKPGK